MRGIRSTTSSSGRWRPDVVLVTPGLHFGSGQADFVKSAQGLGIPAWMLLFSWDNLSTKGALHVAPDLMFVWNERQRREAAELHDYPPDRVVVVGAPRFDPFFALRSAHRAAGLLLADRSRPGDADAALPLFVALHRRGRAAVHRVLARRDPRGRRPAATCNVMIRPHPDVPFEAAADAAGRPLARTAAGHGMGAPSIRRCPRAVVLRTTYRTQEAFFECLHHADAVVALNTSAELEAGIAGRPVFTVLANDRSADGQAHTLHFNYLLREHGGFVSYAGDSRVARRAAGIGPERAAAGRRHSALRARIPPPARRRGGGAAPRADGG